MKRLLACAFVSLFAVAAAFAGHPKVTLRAHLEGNEHDGEVFSTQLRSPSTNKKITIQKIPAISEYDVTAFRAFPADGGTFGVLFQLNDHGRIVLDTLSVERRGTFLYVFLNGRPAAELQIDRRITDGQLYLASGVTAADVEMMKKEWPIIGAVKKRR